MNFQINGTTVLDSSGIQNNANSFRTLDGNSILGSGNITDSGPADALLYAKVGVYTWASILKRPAGSLLNDYDTNFTVAAGGTIPASQLGCAYESSNFHYRQGLNEPYIILSITLLDQVQEVIMLMQEQLGIQEHIETCLQ